MPLSNRKILRNSEVFSKYLPSPSLFSTFPNFCLNRRFNLTNVNRVGTSPCNFTASLYDIKKVFIICFVLDRDWRWSSTRPESLKVEDMHRKVIQWFVDEPNPRCPFSIHQLTEIGMGKIFCGFVKYFNLFAFFHTTTCKAVFPKCIKSVLIYF